MKPLNQLTGRDLAKIKMIVFDVDGVLVPRGTKIIAKKQIKQIKALHKKGYLINISSGRGLYMLQAMFREVLPFVSLTYECGSATWYQGRLYQHFNSFKYTLDLFQKLQKAVMGKKDFKGFEPKEFIVTVHCKKRMKQVEATVKKEKGLTTIWNGEAYDILVKHDQTKALGLRRAMKIFKLKKENVLAIGDNYNDQELLREAGLPISADRTRVKGKFYIPLRGQLLPADLLMQKILSLETK